MQRSLEAPLTRLEYEIHFILELLLAVAFLCMRHDVEKLFTQISFLVSPSILVSLASHLFARSGTSVRTEGRGHSIGLVGSCRHLRGDTPRSAVGSESDHIVKSAMLTVACTANTRLEKVPVVMTLRY